MAPPVRPPKRQYQPSITTYLARTNPDPAATAPRPDTLSPPPPPDAVQVSLLNVGMRVRKAVPEGYKNMPLTPPPLTHPHARPNEAQAQQGAMPAPQQQSRRRAPELLPFCGLHKVGGYAAQDAGAYAMDGLAVEQGLEGEAFFSSQGSEASTVSMESVRGAKKRTVEAAYEEEDEEDVEDVDDDQVGFLQPRFGGHRDGLPHILNEERERRLMAKAVPPGRRAGRTRGEAGAGQRGRRGESLDFGDATFLDPGLLLDADEEMGGM